MAELVVDEYSDFISFDSTQAPGGLVVYYADGDEEIIYVNQYVIDLFECESEEDFLKHVNGSFRSFVYADDIDAVEDSIWEQVVNSGGFDRICYRIQTKTGRVISVEDYGHLEENGERERPVFYVFVSEMRQRGPIDWLTGLPSVERFYKMAELRAAAIEGNGSRPAALALDLVGMHTFNAKNGREEGDRLICLFADMLRAHFGNEACTRYADGHFFAFASEEGLSEKLEQLRDDYLQQSRSKSTPIKIGVYVCEPEDEISTVGFGRAMVACDYRENIWQSSVEWFNDEMKTESKLRAHVINNLDTAIEQRWIRPYYQAIVRASTSKVCGEEALARWVDPELGFLSPAEFIPVLEVAGLLYKLDMHMVDCVLEDMLIKIREEVPIVPVSVNISLRDVDKINLVETIARKADAAGVSRKLLRVEFTESAASDNPELFNEQLTALRAAGFEVWMDDFGSGYSSLNMLRDFNFDLIKLDMGFVMGDRSDKASGIVSGVVNIARNIGEGTLAEGVETEEQARFLESVGCGMLQGYYYSKPLELDVVMDHFKDGLGIPRENYDEVAYWNLISNYDIENPESNVEGRTVDGSLISEFPAGVMELRDGVWYYIRTNRALREFLDRNGILPKERPVLKSNAVEGNLGDDFFKTIERCDESGSWERIAGQLEYGTGFQFYMRRMASTEQATAYAVASVPTMLGTALGTYGDVPVAYAVFRVILNDAEDAVVNTEYVYANPMYCEWLGVEPNSLTGRPFLETVEDAGTFWFSYCYRAAVNKETLHDVVYSPELNHWLSFSIAPSPVEGCCIYAFTQVDEEHREQEKVLVGRDTSDQIIEIARVLNSESDYDTAMNSVLEIMSRVVHPDRLYVFERGETTTSNTFEWCAEGVEPEIDTLQNMDNSEFDTWGKLLAEDSVVLISDVAEFMEIDYQMYQTLERQGITHLLAVPFYNNGELIGYLGADNYVFEERLDTRRLLESVAAFMGSRIANQRLLEELTWTGLHDSLTGILNRRGIDQAVLKYMAGNPGAPFALALMDVDDFKGFNDIHDHGAGDAILRTIAHVVQESFPDETIIGRNGGDEFLVMVVGDDVARADDLFQMFSQQDLSCEYDGYTYSLSMSIGYVLYPDQVGTLKAAYNRADRALYEVKRAGKAGMRKYSPEMK